MALRIGHPGQSLLGTVSCLCEPGNRQIGRFLMSHLFWCCLARMYRIVARYHCWELPQRSMHSKESSQHRKHCSEARKWNSKKSASPRASTKGGQGSLGGQWRCCHGLNTIGDMRKLYLIVVPVYLIWSRLESLPAITEAILTFISIMARLRFLDMNRSREWS
jgi:hypothetical protein